MQTNVVIGILAMIIAVASMGILVFYFLALKKDEKIKGLLGGDAEAMTQGRRMRKGDLSAQEVQKLKKITEKNVKRKTVISLEEKFFQAGMFSDKEKADFKRLRLLAPLVLTPIMGIVLMPTGFDLALCGSVLGLLIGLKMPFSILERKILYRAEEIMYYLPLVIEQIAIGVSSSLDIGPCLQRVVSMADERDSHNVVTELIRHAQHFVKSGVPLEDAMFEVGKASGNTELKHAFMSLAQVAKHGGEITRQLQELADSVSSQRETKIEEKIKTLELKATGPVALVFMGFFIIFLSGFAMKIKGAL